MSRNNTGNPIDSKAYADFEDNVANFDQWSISEEDSFKDRKGEERLTLRGTERAGAGDTSVATDAAARAVEAAGRIEQDAEQIAQDAAAQVIDAIDGQVERAEGAADRAESASNSVAINADIYPSVSAGRAAVADGEQFQVLQGNYYARYRRDSASSSPEVGRFISGDAAALKSMVTATLLTRNPADVTTDTAAGTIKLSGRIVQGSRSILLDKYTRNLPGGSSDAYLLCNMVTGEIRVSTGSNLSSMSNDEAVFGMASGSGYCTGFPGGYTRDGIIIGSAEDEVRARVGEYYGTGTSSIQVNTMDYTLAFAEGRIIADGRISISVPSQVYDYSAISGQGVSRFLIFNRSTGVISTVLASQLSTLTDMEIIFGQFIGLRGELRGIPTGYMRNGMEIGDDRKTARDRQLSVPLAWDLSGYLQLPSMPGYRDTDPLPMWDITSSILYSWYDDLMAQYPSYISRSLLGNTATGLPVYAYRFNPGMPRSEVVVSDIPKVMIQSGIHAEPISYLYVYHLMKAVCENWQDDEKLECMRWGVEWSIIPALSPWGVDNKSRVNSNGVNINRNYPEGWSLTPNDGYNYSGPSASSELETQYSLAALDAFKPHIFIDAHNYTTKPTFEFIWFPTGDRKTRSAGIAAVNLLARKWRGENSWMPSADKLGYASGPRGGTADTTAGALGYVSGTFEVSERIYYEPGGAKGSPLTIRYATEALANTLCVLLRNI